MTAASPVSASPTTSEVADQSGHQAREHAELLAVVDDQYPHPWIVARRRAGRTGARTTLSVGRSGEVYTSDAVTAPCSASSVSRAAAVAVHGGLTFHLGGGESAGQEPVQGSGGTVMVAAGGEPGRCGR